MSDLVKSYEELKAWFVGETEKSKKLDKDYEKAERGNKAAGVRVRAAMQAIRATAKDVRDEMLVYRKNADVDKAKKKAAKTTKVEAEAKA